MRSMPAVTLDPANEADGPLLGELIELYAHELSSVFPGLVAGPDGRYGYPRLPLYWSEPERRFAFIIRADGAVAGFALATRGSPATEDPDVLDVAEFFVKREYRRLGVGECAARLLWRCLPGVWTVRVAEANLGGLAFWGRVLAAIAPGDITVCVRTIGQVSWRIHTFDSAPRDRAAQGPARR
jgi:predicted acetyltransferase